MNHSAQRKMLRVVGIIMVVLLPVMLSLWFAHIRAVKETGIHLRSFAQLALDKTERVIGQVDLARSAAEKYHGQVCSPEHRSYMLNIIRGSLYVADLIYARSFYARQLFTLRNRMLFRLPSIKKSQPSLFITIVIRHFIPDIKWSICRKEIMSR